MGKANKHAKQINNKVLFNLSSIFFIVTFIAFIVVMPFLAGLLIGKDVKFNLNLNIAFLLSSILVVFYALTQLNKKTIDNESRIQHIIWILPLSSLLSQINPVSSYDANLSTLILVQACFMFIVSFAMNKDLKLEKILFWTIFASLTIFVAFGLMNWFSTYSFFGLFGQYNDAVWNSGTGKRLASVFQYPNTYAAFLIFFSLISLFGSIMVKHPKHKLVLIFPLVATLVSLLLTESRWGWLSFPIIFVLCLPFFTFKKQLQAILTLIICGVITLIVLSPITNMGLQLQEQFSYGKAAIAWLIVIGASLLSLVTVIFSKWFNSNDEENEREKNTVTKRLFIPILSIVLGAVGAILLLKTSIFTKLLPATISERIASISLNQHSVLERFTFYRDAISVFKDYPILGAGGGGWNALYQMYQSNPYVSSEVHSFYLQLLLEKGLAGFIITLIVFIGIYVLFIASAIKKQVSLYSFSYFIIATTILFNSALDFHMSYAYTIIFLFIAFGGMLAASSDNLSFIKLDKTIQTATGFIKAKWIPALCMIGAIIFGLIAVNNISAFSIYKKAYASLNQVPYMESLEQAEKAASKTGQSQLIDYHLQLLIEGYRISQEPELLIRSKEAIAKYEKAQPYEQSILRNKIELAQLENNNEQYIALLNQAIKLSIWDISNYELLMSQYALQLTQASLENNTEQIKNALASIHAVEQNIKTKMDYLLTLPPEQKQGRSFSITVPIAAALGEANFIEGKYDLAETYLSQAIDQEFNYNGSIHTVIYYLALMEKTNQDYSSKLNEFVNISGLDENTILSQINQLVSIDLN